MHDDPRDNQRDDEHFLSRWSRRKTQAREQPGPTDRTDAPLAGVTPAAPSAMAPHAEAPERSDVSNRSAEAGATARANDRADNQQGTSEALPSIDSLRGLDSEYGEFLKPEVGEDTRRAALKKLFADPHFNQMDGLDVYIDDYNKFEPMPAAVASSLAAFHRLSVFDHLASEQSKTEPSVDPDEGNANVASTAARSDDGLAQQSEQGQNAAGASIAAAEGATPASDGASAPAEGTASPDSRQDNPHSPVR